MGYRQMDRKKTWSRPFRLDVLCFPSKMSGIDRLEPLKEWQLEVGAAGELAQCRPMKSYCKWRIVIGECASAIAGLPAH
jgi:hypothetical protein